MDEHGDIPAGEPETPPDAEQVILENVARLLGSKDGPQPTIHSGLDAIVPVEDLLEIDRRAERISLSSAQTGDVIWWKTQSGTNGYFLVNEAYTNSGNGLNGIKDGIGKFLITRREGHPLGDQNGEGNIMGATLGGMLKKDTIMKGAQLEYEITVSEAPAKQYKTTSVTEMGIIKAGQLSQK